MKIELTSVLVNDQAHALAFYTEVLGFMQKRNIPLGEVRWLTVVSAEGPDHVELLLEPNSNPAARTYQRALLEQGIPLTAFRVADLDSEYVRLKSLGVSFSMNPTDVGMASLAVFDDTCGNLIQIYQAKND
ncbi:hypothetical protein GETHLI_15990 [Geothrix limicola]|uniref:VOC domain-containing protein n=1 Tax=Geothrix limicola TaxID=2927978 RepID=A0ABQ5QEM8_9BACT|nr:VOC family protein [Geothrix limicola]GLH73097.1 hypothetical protein GETHLI_15990 [Geothrix limicola]